MITPTEGETSMKVFEEHESAVRSYSRGWPTVFTRSKGYKMWDAAGKEYIDFFAGAGTLNYGHNNDIMQEKMIEYIQNDGVVHSLDMATTPRGEFLKQFNEKILAPRNLDYKIMFPGPTGTNSVEAALKIARKVTGRDKIISFTNAFHGMTLGALSITGNESKRKGAGVALGDTVFMPFDDFVEGQDSIEFLETFLSGSSSGVDLPAAIIVETVQGEGGINSASFKWLKRLEKVANRFDVLLIVDDIQAGCGRTGTFFSFEEAGLNPDIVCLSKSLGGIGLPMAITLIKPEYDQFEPGEHNGTFRGNNLAFIAATEALNYWVTDELTEEIKEKAKIISDFTGKIVKKYPSYDLEQRGRGLMQGIAINESGLASKVCAHAFEKGLILETSGPSDEVVKFLPPLIIDEAGLKKGLKIVEESIEEVING